MRVALLTLAAFAFASTALAAGKASDIAGEWTFRTGKFSNGCTMTGEMKIVPAANGAYSCTFSTHETCNNLAGEARQSCSAVRKGDKLSITSKVISVDPAFAHYYADDFELTIVNGGYMKGDLNSAGSADVEFFRGDAPVS